MTSVQLGPNSAHQAQPFLAQAVDFLGLDRMRLGNALQLHNLVFHQPQVCMWDYPAADHCIVSVQGLAGEGDAAVGFGWGHRRSMP